MTEMPLRVVVLGQAFTIDRPPAIHIDEGEGEDMKRADATGVCSPEDNAISIISGLGRGREVEAFLHENLHAMTHLAGLADPNDLLTHEADEALVSRLTPILMLWLRDNPLAVEYIQRNTA